MKRRERRVVIVATFVAPLVVVAACAFPDVTFGPGPDSNEAGTSDANAPERDAGRDVVGGDVDTGDVDTGDVVTRNEASAVVDAGACEAGKPHCDCDNDGYGDIHCDVDASVLGLKLDDCDDLDPVRHPDQGFVAEVPPPGRDGDWNCDGVVDRSPGNDLKCGGSGLGGCTGGSGFVNAPSCGEKADFYSCEPQANALAQCIQKPTGSTPVQLCR